MKSTFRYIPQNSKEITRQDLNSVVYVYGNSNGQPAAIAYVGKSNKPAFHFRFTDEQRRNDRIAQFFKQQESLQAARREYREQRSKLQKSFHHSYQPGDILYASWGYEQTNVDFYQIVAVTERTVTFREVTQRSVDSDARLYSGTCVPVKDSFKDELVHTRTVRAEKDGKGTVAFAEFKGDYKKHLCWWDGKPKYYSGDY